MRLPPLPPTEDQVWADTDPRRRLALLSLADTVVDDYRPWRETRFREPPAVLQSRFLELLAQIGTDLRPLTTAEWWWLLHHSRLVQARRLPTLTTINGDSLRFCLPDTLLAQVDVLSSQLSGNRDPASTVATSTQRERFLRTALEEEAITSSQLEGAATTRQVAKQMLRTGRKPRTHSEQMIANNFAAMQRVREMSELPLSPDLVRELHAIVTAGTLDDPRDAGRLQTDADRRVVVQDAHDGDIVHRPPPAHELPGRLERLCEFANSTDGPYLPGILRAVTIHFMTSYDHYFVDGNGRTARTLFYWSMLRQGYWLAEYLTVSTILRKAPSQYMRSFLDVEQDAGDLTYFYIYHVGVLRRAVAGLNDYLDRVTQDRRAVHDRLRLADQLNPRQVAVIADALDDPRHQFTAHELAARFSVTEQTGRDDLADMERRGLMVRSRIGHHYAWTATMPGLPTDDLA